MCVLHVRHIWIHNYALINRFCDDCGSSPAAIADEEANMLIQIMIALATTPLVSQELRQQVICAETMFSRTAEQRDMHAFLEVVDPDARFGTLQMARGREAIAESWAAVFDADGPLMRWRPQLVEVSADGMLAISRGPFRSVRTGDDGEKVETWGHFICTWRRNDDGRWQVLFDTGGDYGMQPSEAQIELLNSDPECEQDEESDTGGENG